MTEHVHRGTVHRLAFQHEPFGYKFWITGVPSQIRIAHGEPGKYSAHMVAYVIRAVHRTFGRRVIVTVH